MSTKVVSTVIAHGPQRWRLNEDGSWSVQMYGSHPFQRESGLMWYWVPVSKHEVPSKVLKEVGKL